MKKITPFFLVALLSLFVLSACNKEAKTGKPCFELPAAPYYPNVEITATNCATQSNQEWWTTTDYQSKTTTGEDVTFLFPETGTYEISQEASGEKFTEILKQTIEVVEAPMVQIDSVLVTSYSETRSDGSSWDILDLPDLEIEVHQYSAAVFAGVEEWPTASPGNDYVFTTGFPVSIAAVSLAEIDLKDNDSFGEELMNTTDFLPQNYSAARPASVNLTDGDFALTLYLTWP